jgi:hypothetical protein
VVKLELETVIVQRAKFPVVVDAGGYAVQLCDLSLANLGVDELSAMIDRSALLGMTSAESPTFREQLRTAVISDRLDDCDARVQGTFG